MVSDEIEIASGVTTMVGGALLAASPLCPPLLVAGGLLLGVAAGEDVVHSVLDGAVANWDGVRDKWHTTVTSFHRAAHALHL